jgi:HNH endonuclease
MDLKGKINRYLKCFLCLEKSLYCRKWNVMNLEVIKEKIIARDGLRCFKTGKLVSSSDELIIEHIIPKSIGGTDDLDNLVLVSHEINSQVSNRVVGSTAGAAILGASLGGPLGMILGGVVGAFLGKSVDEGKKNG